MSFSQPDDQILIQNADHVITVKNMKDSLRIILEAVKDTTNDLLGSFPAVDFAGFDIDMNHNGQVDDGVDVAFGTIGGTVSSICTQRLKSEDTSTGCGGFETDASLKASLSSSENEAQDHLIWTYTIPKKDIFMDASLSFVVKFWGSNKGYITYPLTNSQANSGFVAFDNVLTYP